MESPAKGAAQYYLYQDNDADASGKGKSFTASTPYTRLKVPPAHLVATLSLVQQKLAHLQIENNSSRHRMRELELELESCKQDVARERQNVMQQEETIARHRVLTKSARRDEENQKRYKDVVEEKKGQHVQLHFINV